MLDFVRMQYVCPKLSICCIMSQKLNHLSARKISLHFLSSNSSSTYVIPCLISDILKASESLTPLKHLNHKKTLFCCIFCFIYNILTKRVFFCNLIFRYEIICLQLKKWLYKKCRVLIAKVSS